jgi:O-antigen ligase
MLTTIVITPWMTYDPVNVPKLAVAAVGGFGAIGALAANRIGLLDPRYKLIQISCLAFIFDLILVFLISGTNTTQEIFGTFGRSTGLVAYVSLCFLLFAGVLAASVAVVSRFAMILLLTGGISIVYGLLQTVSADPLEWRNKYGPVIGFLGNPNFQSSFVGLSGILAISIMLSGFKKSKTRVGYLVYVLLALFVIKQTDSMQGFLVFAGGSTLVVLVWISKSQMKALTMPAVVSSAIGFVLVALGSLNIGPLGGLLYQDSVAYRGDYWRAGWEMSVQHPFFGVGLDSYGDWYRRTRTVEATLRRGPDITSNAAHNVLIDFSATGGFPLAAIYLLLMAFVAVAAFRLVRRSNGFDPFVTGLIGVWISYQAQSVISLNQLGIAVWGWIISGLIIGYEIKSRPSSIGKGTKELPKKGRTAPEIAQDKVAPLTTLGMSVGLIVGLFVGLPPLVASSKFLSALQSGDVQRVEKAAYLWPNDPVHMGGSSGILLGNGVEAPGLSIATDAVEKFPDNFELWWLLAKIPSATIEQKAQALAQMKRLDPNNPNLK